MMKKRATTKDSLLTSAGELFGTHGYEAVSTRMIAEKASVKVSAIHYHFGSKEQLYIKTCLTVHSREKATTFADVIAENPPLAATPAGQAEIIRTTIFRRFHEHFRPDRPEWEAKLLLRELSSPTKAMKAIVERVFKPDAESSADFYQKIKPTATRKEAAAWSDMLYGELLLYSMAKQTIEMIRGANALDTEFYLISATRLARAMILEAGLELPKDLC